MVVCGITSHWWMRSVICLTFRVLLTTLSRFLPWWDVGPPFSPFLLHLGQMNASMTHWSWKCSHGIHLSHLTKGGNGWWTTAQAWEVGIIVHYVWNEFYTDPLPQVFRVEVQNILLGDIITFAMYEVQYFHLSTEFAVPHTQHQWQFSRPHCRIFCIFCLIINDIHSSINSFIWRSVGL